MRQFLSTIFYFFIASAAFCQQLKLVLPTRHVNYIPLLCFTMDNKYLISISQDKTLKIWDTQTGMLIDDFITNDYVPYKYQEGLPFYRPPFVPAKRSVSGDTIYVKEQTQWLYNTFTNGLITLKVCSSNDSVKIYNATNNKYIINTEKAGICRSFDGTKIDLKIPTGLHGKQGYKLEISKNNINVWSAWIRLQLDGKMNNLSTAAISSDGNKVAIATHEGDVAIWNLQKSNEIACIGHVNMIGDVLALPQNGAFLYCIKGFPPVTVDTVTHKIIMPTAVNGIKFIDFKNSQIIPLTSRSITYSKMSMSGDKKKLFAVVDIAIDDISNTCNVFDITRLDSIYFTGSRGYNGDELKDICSSYTGDTIAFRYVGNGSTGDIIVNDSFSLNNSWSANPINFSSDGKRIFTTQGIWDIASRNKIAPLLSPDIDTAFVYANFSPDSSKLLTVYKNGHTKVWDTKFINPKALLELDGHSISPSIYSANGKTIITNQGSSLMFWDSESGKLLYTFFSLDSIDFITQLPNGYYQSTPNTPKLLHYVTKDLKVITFEQLDVKYNRPDKVLEAIGNTDTALIKSYRKAYEKRIKKLGIDTTQFRDGYSVPEADFVNRDAIEYEQKNGTLTLHIKGQDSTYKLDRFNIWVNESPLFGKRGISIKRKNSNSIDTTITIKLSQEENSIETSITNVNGTESYRMPLYVNYNPTVKQKETLHFIGIGIDQFVDNTYNLKYSTKDIRDLSKKLKEKYKDDIVIDTLFNENVTTENVKALKQKLQQTTVNDKVIISYSGHGMLSKEYDYYLSTYSVNFQKPEENGLPYDELENLLDSIPARKKLMLIDACHSGEVDKEELTRIENINKTNDVKGLKPVAYKKEGQLGLKNSFELMQSLFVNVGKSTGATIISAAAGTQFALERNDLKNGVFTYSILEAMNKYPTLKIGELRKIVGERVEELTKGLQKPTSRNETIAVDWRVW